MKILIAVTAILFCFSFGASAQSPFQVKGSVADTSTKVNLGNTTISVLNAKDSTLVRFGIAGADGAFSIGRLKKGTFILLVTYPQYADYVEKFSLDSVNRSHDFGKLNLILKSRLLADVMIKGQVTAIKIKGDTTEFNAKAYVIQPNSKVEDLLRQLPGMQVDKDGKITAQGQTVSKVLVDGEEFFGDDPTLVTKNIRGDMVDKVQLYDKKSDQATFTGIDDGQRTKTINIQLKEDKKSGYFGKADGGGATDQFYQGQLMANLFKAKKKFSFYGNIANTGRTGLSFQDNAKYGSVGSNVEFIDGGMMISGGSGDALESFSGRYDGQGIPMARTSGIHYDSKWNADKETINANYKVGSLAVDGARNTLSQNNLPSGTIKSNSDQNYNNDMFRQKLDLTYTTKLDSVSSLKLSVDGTLMNSKTLNANTDTRVRANDALQNGSNRTISNDADQQTFNASAFYSRKLKKAGRTVSANLSGSLNKNTAEGFLNSVSKFYNTTGMLDSTANIDQYKTTDTKSNVLSSNLTYTEPFSKTFSLVFNYGIGVNNSSADRKSFNQSAPGVYQSLDSKFSNNFELSQLSNQGGAVFSYRSGKKTLNFGTKAAAITYNQKDRIGNTAYKRSFLNWTPQANFTYRSSQYKSVSLNYNGSMAQPSIDQLNPVRINTDPLYVTLGNPLLRPAFNNRVGINYNSYKVLSAFSIYANSSFSITTNPIVNNVVTDEAGKTTNQSINLPGKNTNGTYLNANIDKSIKAIDLSVGGGLNFSSINNLSMQDNVLNTRSSQSYSFSLSFYKYKEKKYNFQLSGGPNYTRSESSLKGQLNNNGSGANANGYFSLYFPGKVTLNSELRYQYRAKTQSFDKDFQVFLLTSSITKKFFKAENLALMLSGNDLLNQNTGFNRNASSTTISQSSYTTIRRYYLLSLTWDFSKMGGAPKAQAPVN